MLTKLCTGEKIWIHAGILKFAVVSEISKNSSEMQPFKIIQHHPEASCVRTSCRHTEDTGDFYLCEASLKETRMPDTPWTLVCNSEKTGRS